LALRRGSHERSLSATVALRDTAAATKAATAVGVALVQATPSDARTTSLSTTVLFNSYSASLLCTTLFLFDYITGVDNHKGKGLKLLKCGYGERWRRSAGQQKSATLKF